MIRHAVEHAEWEVMWVVRKDGENHIIAHDFEDNLAEAIALYVKVVRAGKHMPTLRCKNTGFPPPDKYDGKMNSYNRRGVWWCPYCMTLRRFEKRHWAELDGEVGYREEATYCCPMCDIQHTDWHVIKYNPIAERLRNAIGRRKRTSKGRKKRGRK